MAGWADLYAAPSGVPYRPDATTLGFRLGTLANQGARADQDYGTSQYDRGVGFSRAASDAVSHMSAQGAGYSSAKNLATNRMFEDYSRDSGKGALDLSRAHEDLNRQRALATFGVLY